MVVLCGDSRQDTHLLYILVRAHGAITSHYSSNRVVQRISNPPASSRPMITEGESPTNADAPLQYFTVDSYEWPKEPPRPKRVRLATEEQKRRHRADQKRFMQRKRARFAMLRQDAALLELQVGYLEVLRDELKLRDERQRLEVLLQVQHAACMSGPSVSRPATPIRLEARNQCEPPMELDSLLMDLLISL